MSGDEVVIKKWYVLLISFSTFYAVEKISVGPFSIANYGKNNAFYVDIMLEKSHQTSDDFKVSVLDIKTNGSSNSCLQKELSCHALCIRESMHDAYKGYIVAAYPFDEEDNDKV